MKYIEILFNTSYLIIIFTYLLKMSKDKPLSSIKKYYFLSFLLLAFGDTFHVGLRSISHLLGDINYSIVLFGLDAKLIGIGAFFTAITVTITYWYFVKVLVIENKDFKFALTSVTVLSVIRMVIIFLPQNNWHSSATYAFGIIRNIPLILIGIIVIYYMYKMNTPFYKKFAGLIILSYLFYLPVIFFVKFIPMIGMLMMPKTVVYLFMLHHVYKEHFKMST